MVRPPSSPPPSAAALDAALRARFGLDAFREGQREVVEAVLRGEDALVIRPTGSGKSLCYQLPALLSPGVTLVVSPLISLMKDQCDALAARGLPALAIHSGLSPQEQGEAVQALRAGRARLCYVAPERFRVARFLEALQAVPVSILAVDEAHCVSEWGHEFRPDYRRLGAAREALGRPTMVALTATATARVRRDILVELGIPEARIHIAGFDRPNLHLEVERIGKRDEKLARLRSLARSLGASGAGIVYCSTRRSAAEVAAALGGERRGAGLYHAGLEPGERVRVQESFMRDELRVLVATNAFGMGIDRPDIRFVAHAEVPRSLEAYYQEAGRAGRDGKPARCLLLYGRADKIVHEYLIDESTPEAPLVEKVWRALAPERGPGPRPDAGDPDRFAARVTPRGPRGAKPRTLAVEAALKLLEKAGHLALGRDRDRRGQTVELLDGTAPEELRVDWAQVAARRSFERERLDRVARYAERAGCRTRDILGYFGDRSAVAFHGRCGHCDGCGATPPEIDGIASDPRAAPRVAQPVFAPAVAEASPGLVTGADDPRTVARKVLSCVARMGGSATRTEAACCLTGSRSGRTSAEGHDRLSTYGLLAALSRDAVLAWVDALTAAGLLAAPVPGKVALSPAGIEVMAGRAPLPPLRGSENIGSRAHREGIAVEGKEEEVLQLRKVAGLPTTQPSAARPSEAPREISSEPLTVPVAEVALP